MINVLFIVLSHTNKCVQVIHKEEKNEFYNYYCWYSYISFIFLVLVFLLAVTLYRKSALSCYFGSSVTFIVNVVGTYFDFHIPINLGTATITSLLGLPVLLHWWLLSFTLCQDKFILAFF